MVTTAAVVMSLMAPPSPGEPRSLQLPSCLFLKFTQCILLPLLKINQKQGKKGSIFFLAKIYVAMTPFFSKSHLC
jgi:hypothetical protein